VRVERKIRLTGRTPGKIMINLKTGKQIRLTLPPHVHARADQVQVGVTMPDNSALRIPPNVLARQTEAFPSTAPQARPISALECPSTHIIKGNFTPSSGERCIYSSIHRCGKKLSTTDSTVLRAPRRGGNAYHSMQAYFNRVEPYRVTPIRNLFLPRVRHWSWFRVKP
jgi:hypothetical protein